MYAAADEGRRTTPILDILRRLPEAFDEFVDEETSSPAAPGR